ncbi:hypothetical protein BVX98_01690 [bacterium F11]|nr:hypothetical protein BVX98_01690 [bacterium F11]
MTLNKLVYSISPKIPDKKGRFHKLRKSVVIGICLLFLGFPSLAVTPLGSEIVSKDPRISRKGLKKIGSLSNLKKQELVRELLPLLKNKESHKRIAVAKALGRIGPMAVATIPDLLKALNDKGEEGHYFFNFDLRQSVVTAVIAMGLQGIPSLKVALGEKDHWYRYGAAIALSKVNPPLAEKKAVPILVPDLKDPNITIRRGCVLTLGEMGPVASPSVPELVKAAKNARKKPGKKKVSKRTAAHQFLRAEIAETLGQFGSKAIQAVPLLVEELRPDSHASPDTINSDVYIYASETLIKIGTAAVPSLIKALKKEELEVQRRISLVLAEIHPPPVEAIPVLEKVITVANRRLKFVDNEKIREDMLQVLGKIDQKSKAEMTSVLKLEEAKRSEEDMILAILGGKSKSKKAGLGTDAIPTFVRALDHQNRKVRKGAAKALGKMGALASEAVPALSHAIFDKDTDVQREAVKALGLIGPSASESIPYLIHALFFYDTTIRLEAIHAIEVIGPREDKVIPYLLRVTKDEDSKVREAAFQTLVRLGKELPQEFDAAVKDIKDK